MKETLKRAGLQGKFIESDFNALVEFTAAGHREIAPVYLREKDTGLLSVYGSHGLYRMGIHADGRPVVLFSADPDKLRPAVHTGPSFRTTAPGYYIDIDGMKDIEVVEARRARTMKKWGAQAISTHSYYQSEIKTEYGFLRRLSDDMWFSRAVAYTLDPATENDRPLYADDGTRLYVLRCYTTAGKGRPFTNDDELAIRRRRTLAFPSRSTYVKKENAEAIIRDDFIRRAELVMRDHDPDKLGHIKGEPKVTLPLVPPEHGWRRKALRLGAHYFVRGVQAAYGELRNLKTQVLVMGVGKTVFLSTVRVLAQGWRAGIGQFFVGIFQPVLNAIKTAQGNAGSNEDIGFSFWKPKRSPVTGARHYCRLDPAQGRLVRYMDYKEADIFPVRGATLEAGLPEDWAEDYLLGTLYSPVGSVAERRRINDMDVLHMLEPSGLELYYLVGRNIVYAQFRPELAHAKADPLNGPVRRLLERKGPVVKVREAADGSLESEGLEPEDFAADLKAETALEGPVRYIPPLAYDLKLLRDFNEQAYGKAQPEGVVARTASRAFNMAANVLRLAKIIGPAADPSSSPAALELSHHLAEREIVPAAGADQSPSTSFMP